MEESGNINEDTIITTTPQQMDPSLAKFILSSEDMLEILYIRLNGMVWDDKEKKYIRDESKALMSRDGVNSLIGTLMNAINHRGIYMSNFNDWEVEGVCEEMLDDIAITLFVNHRKYEIRSLSDRTVIINAIRTNLLASLKRPFGEGERKLYGKTAQERHNIDQGKKRSGLPGLGRFRGVG